MTGATQHVWVIAERKPRTNAASWLLALVLAASWLYLGWRYGHLLHSSVDVATPVVLGLVSQRLSGRRVDRVELHSGLVRFALPRRTVDMHPSTVRRLSRHWLTRDVLVDTASGRFRIDHELRGLHDLAVQLQTLNPDLRIDGP